MKRTKRQNIYNFLCEHDSIDTRVGEGGILLSGGRSSALGIARAISDDPEILVLDEATGALRFSTEGKDYGRKIVWRS